MSFRPSRRRDRRMMGRAHSLARLNHGLTGINPSVGCIILNSDGHVVGAGVTGLGGRPHAEEVALDEGKFLNPTLVDYHICSTLDVPDLTARVGEVPHPDGPFGAKGVGEPALAPTAAAIANAIFDAVGIPFNNLPLTPEVVWAALREAADTGDGPSDA